jgi:hypothetical protein
VVQNRDLGGSGCPHFGRSGWVPVDSPHFRMDSTEHYPRAPTSIARPAAASSRGWPSSRPRRTIPRQARRPGSLAAAERSTGGSRAEDRRQPSGRLAAAERSTGGSRADDRHRPSGRLAAAERTTGTGRANDSQQPSERLAAAERTTGVSRADVWLRRGWFAVQVALHRKGPYRPRRVGERPGGRVPSPSRYAPRFAHSDAVSRETPAPAACGRRPERTGFARQSPRTPDHWAPMEASCLSPHARANRKPGGGRHARLQSPGVKATRSWYPPRRLAVDPARTRRPRPGETRCNAPNLALSAGANRWIRSSGIRDRLGPDGPRRRGGRRWYC